MSLTSLGSVTSPPRSLPAGTNARLEPEPTPCAQACDEVELSTAESPDAKYQKYKRLGTNCSLLILGDVPAAVSIGVGLNMIPGLAPYSALINSFNSLTGYLGLASDISVARDCWNNPDAPKIDKVVDAVHIGSDLINTGSSMVPLFTSLNNPVAMGVFIGGQALGAVCDAAKLVWDWKRGGTQSARLDADAVKNLILDPFEQKAAQLPVMVGTVAANSLAFPASFSLLSATLAAPLTAIGGAFGAVYGFTQVKKSKKLLAELQTLKKQGQSDFEMPRWSHHNLETYHIQVDKAMAQVKRNKLFGYGQILGSAVLMAAGCISFAPLAVAGIAISAAVGGAAVGTELVVHRKEFAEKLNGAWHKLKAAITPTREAAPLTPPPVSNTAPEPPRFEKP